MNKAIKNELKKVYSICINFDTGKYEIKELEIKKQCDLSGLYATKKEAEERLKELENA